MVRITPRLVHLATFVGAAIVFVPGCVGRGYVVADAEYTSDYEYSGYYPDELVVYQRPPPPRLEFVVGTAPGPDYTWLPGYWDWQGSSWSWVGGSWVVQRPGFVWTPPLVRVVDGRTVYLHGFWRPESRPLPPIYTQPGRIAVSARVQAQPGVSYEGRLPIATRPMPPGHAMQEEHGLPPGRAMQEERRGPYATPAPMPPGQMRERGPMAPMPPGHMRERGPIAQPMPPGRVEERGPVYRPMPPAPGPERRVEVGPQGPPDVAPPQQGRGRPRPMAPMGPPVENRGRGRGPH